MSDKLQVLLSEIKSLEREVEGELHRVKSNVSFSLKNGNIHFTPDILKFHRSLRKGIVRYLSESQFLFILTAPVIYSLIIPAFILDCFCGIYQTICFPLYRIPRVDRGDYIRMDRHKLAYLNGVEKFNCDYCAYFNGVLAYARETASRTEQYWCPIRHAIAIKGAHERYKGFAEYGDAEAYHQRLEVLRRQLSEGKKPS